MDLNIIIPLYNYEGKLLVLYNNLIDDINGIDYNLIFINNGSTDFTLEELKNIHKKDFKRVKIIDFSKKCSFNEAIKAGILHSKSKLTAIFDVESNISIKYIKKMYNFIKNNEDYDLVSVNKIFNNNNLFNKLLNNLVNKMFKTDYSTESSNCYIFRKSVLQTLNKNNLSINDIDNLSYNCYFYIVKTNKRKNINHIINNNISKLIKYIAYTYLMISTLLFIIYIVLCFSSKLKFNVLSIFLFLIQIGIALIILCTSMNKCNNINKYNKYIIKNTFGLDDDIL